MKYLIVNADDFGISPGVNKGVVEAYKAGGITSTTLMVNMPGFKDAINWSRSLPDLGVGLHFNLTYGRPVSNPNSIPSLVQKDGTFYNIKTVCTRDERDIETELTAQWNRFLASGLRPTHLDSHHHIHQIFPSVYKTMAHLAEKENIPMRRSQTTDETVYPSPLMTDYVILDTYEKQDGLNLLLQYLNQLPEGTTELMCHPGYADDILREISEWTDAREAELAVFRDPAIKQTCQALNIQPIHYGMLSSILKQPSLITGQESLSKKSARKRRNTLVLKRRRNKINNFSNKLKKNRWKPKSKMVTFTAKFKTTKKRSMLRAKSLLIPKSRRKNF
ncbi:hypothetical protein SAMN04487897_104161 [Paenibacillus sp. yr247]|uniref:carbohydrate deacetylase n=1 Tax=Paenibacillus sp. yr247 TaxID=1761880 RepID=UPI00088AB803|nr:carbohydrate deacetylase [Paenibacillus sp. yr247]SDN71025.1 hypothetical protein SAMN04487897_104161 [Paenibacillus sp. yr247]